MDKNSAKRKRGRQEEKDSSAEKTRTQTRSQSKESRRLSSTGNLARYLEQEVEDIIREEE